MFQGGNDTNEPAVSPTAPARDMLQDLLDDGADHVVSVVKHLVAGHEAFNRDRLNLVASHNYMSPAAKSMLCSALADQILSGQLGSRVHAGAAWIDAMDQVLVDLCRRIYHVEYVEYRAMSGALANGLALLAMTSPGDRVLALAPRFGGHNTYREPAYAGLAHVEMHDIPCDESTGQVDIEELAKAADRVRPRLLIVGSAQLLFPYPLREMHEIMDSIGGRILYDGAHILGLVAGGEFQDPIADGATLTGSTQKTLGGPIGGLILTNDGTLAERVGRLTSDLIANYHNNRIAALIVTLAEMTEYAADYARQVVRNARALAAALVAEGVPVVGRGRDYTASHVVMIDPTSLKEGTSAFERLEAAGVLTTKMPLFSSFPERRGIRLGTAGLTRTGAKEEAMRMVAGLIAQVIVRGDPPARVATQVRDLAHEFSSVHYCISAG